MTTIQALVRLVTSTDLSYNQAAKNDFHSKGRAVLRQVAKALGLVAGTYDIRSNQGGIAVSGEVTLHAENVYIQLSQGALGGGSLFMYRHCKGRKDYCGSRNRWMSFDNLVTDFDGVIAAFKEAQSEI